MSDAKELEISIPIRDAEGYAPRHLQVQLSPRQAETLRSIAEALYDREERVNSGRRVQSSPQAVQWILDQVSMKLIPEPKKTKKNTMATKT